MADMICIAFENTGKSGGLTGLFLFMLLLPTFLAIMISILKTLFSSQHVMSMPIPSVPEIETETFTTVTMQFTDDKATSNLTKEEQWQVIADATMEKAMQGDKAARDWVTKHIFTDPVAPESISNPLIKDAVDALKSVGYKSGDVKKVAVELCSQNDYASLEDLIQDIVKNC
tara:strand:+ start:21 stop:536 length:516 start_codon:yes stop_codon:yes gene_type:complete